MDLDRDEADRDLDRREERGGLVSGSHWDVYLRARTGLYLSILAHKGESLHPLFIMSVGASRWGVVQGPISAMHASRRAPLRAPQPPVLSDCWNDGPNLP